MFFSVSWLTWTGAALLWERSLPAWYWDLLWWTQVNAYMCACLSVKRQIQWDWRPFFISLVYCCVWRLVFFPLADQQLSLFFSIVWRTCGKQFCFVSPRQGWGFRQEWQGKNSLWLIYAVLKAWGIPAARMTWSLLCLVSGMQRQSQWVCLGKFFFF